MDLTVSLRAWNSISPELQQLVEDEVRIYSQKHYLAIQERNIAAMEKFKAEGDMVTRLSQEDLETWRKAAIPIWFNWANKNEDARAILDIQLDYMMNETVGYITEEDVADYQ
jgi:TRAP-type C4-dicarboxylate transport system substrate-binding protein